MQGAVSCILLAATTPCWEYKSSLPSIPFVRPFIAVVGRDLVYSHPILGGCVVRIIWVNGYRGEREGE